MVKKNLVGSIKLANENFFYLAIPFLETYPENTFTSAWNHMLINMFLVTTKFGNTLNNNLWD